MRVEQQRAPYALPRAGDAGRWALEKRELMELVELIYQWLSTHKGKQDDILDALAFHIAGNEVAHKNMVPWLYTKIFSECNGDEKQLIASYIKIRHPQIREEIIRIFVFEEEKRKQNRLNKAEQIKQLTNKNILKQIHNAQYVTHTWKCSQCGKTSIALIPNKASRVIIKCKSCGYREHIECNK